MTGVIMAGGEGSRMGLPYNKHAALVYDRPMIEYPLQTLQDMGCDAAIVVTSPEGLYDMNRIVGTRAKLELQPQPNGSPGALAKAEGRVEGVFPVLCGDVYLDPAPPPPDGPTLYWQEFDGAHNHSVWNPETDEITEKPARALGQRAIIAYAFDERVFEVIRELEPSARGELELTDIYSWYLENGVKMVEYQGFFQDMGTPDGLLKVANHIKVKQ